MNDMSSLSNDQRTSLRITSLENEVAVQKKMIEELRDREANIRKAYDKSSTQAKVWEDAFVLIVEKLVEK